MEVARFLSALWERQSAAGLTNAALAQRIGVHESTISRLKRGKRDKPHLDTLFLIVHAFPELRVLLSDDLPIRSPDVPIINTAEMRRGQ